MDLNRLTQNFSVEELTCSQVAVRNRMNNTPTPDVLDNLRPPCRQAAMYQLAADALRAAYDVVMNVN